MTKRIHPSITIDRVMQAVQQRETTLDNPGFCLACGEDVEGVEPDAREYECECCGEPKVYGAEEIMFMMA